MLALVSMLMNMQWGNLIFVYLYLHVTVICCHLHLPESSVYSSKIISVVSRTFAVFVMKVASQVSEECVDIYFVYCCLLLKQKKGIFSLSYYDSWKSNPQMLPMPQAQFIPIWRTFILYQDLWFTCCDKGVLCVNTHSDKQTQARQPICFWIIWYCQVF